MALSIKDRKVQLVVVGGLGLVLVAFLLMKVMGGGGGSASPATAPTGGSSVVVPSTAPSPSPAPTTVLVFSGRDPFQDLFSGSQNGSPSGSTTPPPSSPGGTGGSSTPPPSGGSTPPPSNPGGGSGQGSSIVVGGHSVLLDDVFVSQSGVRKAQVDVDGTVYTVAAGESFHDNFKLVSFPSPTCAHFVFGDTGFTLCEAGGK
jgi:hypothetical protein